MALNKHPLGSVRKVMKLFLFLALALAVGKPALADDAGIVAETDARILKNRTGTLLVQALDQNGKPLAKAKIRLEHTGHLFKFGAAYHHQFPVEQPPQDDVDQRHQDAFLKLFNYSTITFYWNLYERQQGQPDEGGNQADHGQNVQVKAF